MRAQEYRTKYCTSIISYNSRRVVISKCLDASSRIYVSFAQSDSQRPCSLSNQSDKLGLFLATEVAPLDLNKGGKFLKKLWCYVSGEYYKIIWFYQVG